MYQKIFEDVYASSNSWSLKETSCTSPMYFNPKTTDSQSLILVLVLCQRREGFCQHWDLLYKSYIFFAFLNLIGMHTPIAFGQILSFRIKMKWNSEDIEKSYRYIWEYDKVFNGRNKWIIAKIILNYKPDQVEIYIRYEPYVIHYALDNCFYFS